MHQHIVPIHLIGALSPMDIERLVIRLLGIEAQREGEPQPGEPTLQDVTLACSPNSGGEKSSPAAELVASARLAGGGDIKARFQVEVRFAEGRDRAIDDFGSLEMLKEMAWPPVRDAVRGLARMLTASSEMRMTGRPRVGLLDRVRWWAARRAMDAAEEGRR